MVKVTVILGGHFYSFKVIITDVVSVVVRSIQQTLLAVFQGYSLDDFLGLFAVVITVVVTVVFVENKTLNFFYLYVYV